MQRETTEKISTITDNRRYVTTTAAQSSSTNVLTEVCIRACTVPGSFPCGDETPSRIMEELPPGMVERNSLLVLVSTGIQGNASVATFSDKI